MKYVLTGVLSVAALAWMASASSADTLSDVKAKGFLQCGVNTGLAGFSAPNDKGDWTGLDVDYCRALAAAVFGDGTKVKFTPSQRQGALHRAAVRRDRRPVAQHDLDDQPRHRARPELRRRHLL